MIDSDYLAPAEFAFEVDRQKVWDLALIGFGKKFPKDKIVQNLAHLLIPDKTPDCHNARCGLKSWLGTLVGKAHKRYIELENEMSEINGGWKR